MFFYEFRIVKLIRKIIMNKVRINHKKCFIRLNKEKKFYKISEKWSHSII